MAAQAALSAANVLQAKYGSGLVQNLTVTLDNPTAEGSTVLIELYAPGSLTAVGTLPDGFELDANLSYSFYTLRKREVPAGETSYGFTYIATGLWEWRITEWDVALEPGSPYEAWATNTAAAVGLTSFSTGTTAATSRPVTVALAMHHWEHAASRPAQTFDWGSHTNGFAERAEQRVSVTGRETDTCWSWLFSDTAGAYETTATATSSDAMDASDTFWAMCVVYAATTYAE